MNLANRLRPVLERPLLLGACFGALGGFFIDALRGDVFVVALQPTTLVLFGILAGVLCGAMHALEFEAATVGALAIIYFAIAFTPLADSLANRWIRNDRVPPSADAVVVLSSDVLADGALNATGIDRLLTGIAIARRIDAPRIVTTRVREVYGRDTITSDLEQRRQIAIAGLEARWIVADSVYSTRDEAVRTAALLGPAVRRIVLVTSPMHTRRACRTFERVGFVVACAAAMEHTSLTRRPWTTHDRFAAFGAYVYERLGMIKYARRGWVRG
jgi:uncharacterized SAM-binding protein YcdF (DUF218 family)